MKCIKNIKTDKVTRVSDDVAITKVNEKTHIFANKAEWKEQGRK
jgi:hypothetical protein